MWTGSCHRGRFHHSDRAGWSTHPNLRKEFTISKHHIAITFSVVISKVADFGRSRLTRFTTQSCEARCALALVAVHTVRASSSVQTWLTETLINVCKNGHSFGNKRSFCTFHDIQLKRSKHSTFHLAAKWFEWHIKYTAAYYNISHAQLSYRVMSEMGNLPHWSCGALHTTNQYQVHSLCSHRKPLNPLEQEHVNAPRPSMHCPAFWQGRLAHSSTSEEKKTSTRHR